MNVKKQEILHKVFLLTFENQKELTNSLIRFQEHYESPKFRNKTFTLKELEEFENRKDKKSNVFNYIHGCNFPSYILKSFYKGKFDPLSEKEKKILKMFQKEKGDFYIIAYHKNFLFRKFILKHEIAHSLFYIDSQYRKEVLKLLDSHKIEKTKKKIQKRGMYHNAVLNDEIHAFSLEYINKFPLYNPILTYKLRKLYKKHVQKNKIN